MKNLLVLGVAVAALSACSPRIPESGVGFSDYNQAALPPAPVVSSGPIASNDLAGAGIGGTGLYPVTPAASDGRVEATPGNAAPELVDNTGISDEQDFDAVAGRETIESDAERRVEQASQYQIVDPGAVPMRQGDTGPNIVDYALNAPNSLGQEWYSRFKYSGQSRYERNCSKYTSSDEAQRDFLARGGPERDIRGIDPDGDGFACAWDPAPFRLARASQ